MLPAAPVESHAGPLGFKLVPLRPALRGCPVRWAAKTGHFCEIWISWAALRTQEKEQRATTKPRVSLNSCIKHPPRAEGREINTDSCYAQAASGIFDREDETRRERARAKEERRAMRHILKAKAAPYCY